MEPGTNLGHYRILEPLGKGGMGQVYLAEDTRLDRQVALKILPPELAQDRDRRERFIREAKAVAALNHPNIVVIHSVEEQDGQVFLTMERIEGAPLTHRIAGGAMPLGELFDLAIPLADAISAAHQKGIAHRDLKPDNVMITPGGVVKVLDFGLAKVVESEESMLEGAATEMLTEEGKILGTVAYMSPEQAQGKAVDGRSDIFALGILLYEMAAGRRPFEGDSKISVLSSLIKDTPAPVTEINRSLPRHLGRIIRHCLEKDPDRRYQSALDVRNELESLREEIRSGEVDLPSGEVPSLSGSVAGASMPSGLSGPHPGTMESAQHSTGAPVSATSHGSGIGDGIQATGSGSHPGMPAAPAPASGGTGRWIGIAALVALVAVAGWWALGRGEATDTAAPNVQPAAADLRQSIAVLPFDNTSGAEDVDWLRDGIAEMLSTDLSQATGLRVVGSERIREVLNELGRDADALESMDSVREVAERTGTTVVIAGSFVQAGDRLRINARLIDAATGEVTAGESVDGAGQDSVFASVDSLSRWIRGTVEPTGEVAPSAAPIDRDLVDVTTDSVDAFRFYAEGLKRADRGEYQQAIDFFLEAVRLDPEFALAYVKISVTYGNLLQYDERRRYAELALEHADRLAERERYYFEGAYYSNSVETLERAVEAYAKAIELYPDDAASRNNMAVQLGLLHRHEESIEHYEETLRRGSAFGGVRTNLVGAYLAIGDLDTARRRARDFMDAEPDSSASYIAMITVLMASGEYDEAERLLERHYDELPLTDRMGPAANLALAAEDWERMEALLARETSGGSPMAGVFAMYLRRNMALARGRSAEAASHMDSVPPEAGDFYWNAQGNVAELELERGDPAAALDRALRVRDETADLETRYWAVSLAARARVALGRNTAAESLVEELETLVARMPFPHQMRGHRLTLGYLALSRDEPAEALRLFESVVPDLESVYLGPLGTPYSSVFLGMGQANLLLGNANAAVEALETVLNSGALYSGDVLARVRAWFFLGQARDALGDEAGAREAFEKFLSYWGDGDIDRDRVAEARAYVAG